MAMAVCCVRCAVLLLEVFVVCWVVAVAVLRAAGVRAPGCCLRPASARCCCFLRRVYLPICRLDTGCMAAAATGAL
jgi:hypothetical protein